MLKKSLFFISVFLISFTIIPLLPVNITGLAIKTEKPLGMGEEIASPADRIQEKEIEISDDRIIIKIPNSQLSRYADSNSMNPVIDTGANGIEIIPKDEDDIYVGDIVTYEQDSLLVVHRVVETGEDTEGRYYIVKGDNNKEADDRIRFEQIRYITIGILY